MWKAEELKESPKSQALNFLKRRNLETYQLSIENLFDTENPTKEAVDSALESLIPNIAIPSDDDKGELKGFKEFVEIVMQRVFEVAKDLKEGAVVSEWMPEQLLDLFQAEVPQGNAEPTNAYRWNEIVQAMLKKIREKSGKKRKEKGSQDEDSIAFDSFGKDLVLHFARTGNHRLLGAFIKILKVEDSIDLCVMKNGCDSELTRKASEGVEDENGNKRITLLLTRFLAIQYYFLEYMSISGVAAGTIEKPRLSSVFPGVANKQVRYAHFQDLLEKLNEHRCDAKQLRVLKEEARCFSVGTGKRAARVPPIVKTIFH